MAGDVGLFKRRCIYPTGLISATLKIAKEAIMIKFDVTIEGLDKLNIDPSDHIPCVKCGHKKIKKTKRPDGKVKIECPACNAIYDVDKIE
jgi:Zn ribbon nucleic-acid-binding protein